MKEQQRRPQNEYKAKEKTGEKGGMVKKTEVKEVINKKRGGEKEVIYKTNRIKATIRQKVKKGNEQLNSKKKGKRRQRNGRKSRKGIK